MIARVSVRVKEVGIQREVWWERVGKPIVVAMHASSPRLTGHPNEAMLLHHLLSEKIDTREWADIREWVDIRERADMMISVKVSQYKAVDWLGCVIMVMVVVRVRVSSRVAEMK